MKKLKNLFSFLLIVFLFINICRTAFADSANISGGSGITGTGTYDNGWCVSDGNGWYDFETEGLRIYLVDKDSGKPISNTKIVDITNYDFDYSQIWYGGKTKYDYLYGRQKLTLNRTYRPIRVEKNSETGQLPKIIPWDEVSSTSRVEEIRTWLSIEKYQDWIYKQISATITSEDARKNGYMLTIEPIAYFRYMGLNYGLTATECSLLDEMRSGDLYCKMNPLTHSNLPLAIFLEEDEFLSSSTPMYAYKSDTYKTRFKDNSIIKKYFGIGYYKYDYEPPESDFPTLDLPITLEAEPDGQEVTGEAGYPANLTENVTLKLSMPLGEAELSKWEEVLLGGETTEKVDEVNVEIKLQSMQYQTVNGTERYIGARDNFKFTGGSVPSSAKSSLSALNREYTSIKMSGEALKK